MKTIVKAIYMLIVAIIVFTGALLILQGLNENQGSDMAVAAVHRLETPFDDQEGSAI